VAGIDIRYQVFVSSTYQDLQEERAEVMQALLELDCMPAGMELFPAASEDQWRWIKRVIDESDYYLVIIGGKYGSVHPETGQRNVSTTLIHPGLEFKLGSGHMAPPFVGHAGAGFRQGRSLVQTLAD
jgi:hypothetical protein